MKPRVEFGLIGAGGYGVFHLRALNALAKSDAVRLAAIVEPDPKVRRHLQSDPETGDARFYDDYREMLRCEAKLDAVTIAAPIPFHYEMAQACLKSGIYIYLEKPPAPLLGQLDHLIELDTKSRVGVGFQLVGSIWAQQLKRWITEGKFGSIREIRTCACWPRPDSYYERAKWVGRMTYEGLPTFDGPATNALAHLIHNIMYLGANGSANFSEPAEVQAELYRARPIESYDIASVRGCLDSGIRFYAMFAHASQQNIPYQLEVDGTDGWARVSCDGKRCESSAGTVECAESVEGLMFKSYCSFVDFVTKNRTTPLTGLRDARGYVLATNAMLLSSGGVHTIDPRWVRRSGKAEDPYYEVENLAELIGQAYRDSLLPSEMNLPWSVRTPVIKTRNFGHDESAAVGRLLAGGHDRVFHREEMRPAAPV